MWWLTDFFDNDHLKARSEFYGVDNDSSVTSIFNDAAGTVKSFNALSYEGTQAQIITDDGDGEYFNEFNNSTVTLQLD